MVGNNEYSSTRINDRSLHDSCNRTPVLAGNAFHHFCFFVASSRTTVSSPTGYQNHTPMNIGCSTHMPHHSHRTQYQHLGLLRTHSRPLQISSQLVVVHLLFHRHELCSHALHILCCCKISQKKTFRLLMYRVHHITCNHNQVGFHTASSMPRFVLQQ